MAERAKAAENTGKGKADAYTLSALINDWELRHLAGMRLSYRRDALGRLRRHLADLQDTPAAQIARADVVKATDRIAGAAGETTARRTIGYARSAFAWAMKRGAVASNPFLDVPVPGREVQRDRVLSPGEVLEVWQATAKLLPPYGTFVRFLLLTLQRREEVAGMTWGEVAADWSEWTIPKERAKNGKAHLIHLAPAARAELNALGKGERDELVFRTVLPTRGRNGKLERRGLTSFSFIKRKMDEAIAATREKAAKEAGTKAEPMPGWRLHDFRRTGVTRLADMGTAPHVADRLLNHVQGTISGVAAVYQRGEFLAERRAALEAWAQSAIATPQISANKSQWNQLHRPSLAHL